MRRSHHRRRLRLTAVLTAATAVIAFGSTAQAQPRAVASAPAKASTPAKAPASHPVSIPDPDHTLGKGWKTSDDRAVTTAADAAGLDVMVADSKNAYAWRTVAVLSEPGFSDDEWIGQDCLMDRSHAAVVYAPRGFTNEQDLMERGAFAAVVDLDTGRVDKLPFTASLAYFDPGCNSKQHTAAFTAIGDSSSLITTVSTAGKVLGRSNPAGEVTSAVPTGSKGQVTAAEAGQLVSIDAAGHASALAHTNGTAYDLQSTANGVAYVDEKGDKATAHVLHSGKAATVATGALTSLALRPGADGKVFATGSVSGAGGWGVSTLPHTGSEDTVSTEGRLAVRPVLTASVRSAAEGIAKAGQNLTATGGQEPDAATSDGQTDNEPVTIDTTAVSSGTQTTEQLADPAPAAFAPEGKAASPALTGAAAAPSATVKSLAMTAAATVSTSTVDTQRECAIPRNDPNVQALQPTPNQVEWAVDMAVRGDLTSTYLTQGSWRSQEGSSVDPQSTFPLPALTGGGRIPAQVLFGILAQESNLWQAESGAVPGQMGNPLAATDGFYGRAGAPAPSGGDYWAIDWAKSDCGYGVGQITDGMRLPQYAKPGETSLPASVQTAVAVDYAVNIAAAARTLAEKWNEIHQSGQTITVNDDNPAHLEDWFAAVWDYNSGLNPVSAVASNGNWGLGWYSNPANPLYKPSRGPFLDGTISCVLSDGTYSNDWAQCSLSSSTNVVDNPSFSDAANPAQWPYEEKVMGWAAESIDTGFSYDTSGNQDRVGSSGYSTVGFRPAWWVNDQDRINVKPPLSAFCSVAVNGCDPTNPPACETEHLGASCDTPYWWNGSNTTWKSDCSTSCGNENLKYATLVSEPGRGYNLLNGEPQCSGGGLPAGAKVVTNVPNGTPTYSSCGNVSGDAGTFSFNFQSDDQNNYEAREDLAQIGGGWGGHFWYSHTRASATGVNAPVGDPYQGAVDTASGPMSIVGTWKLSTPASAWTRVMVHLPDTGSVTQQATYTVHTGAGNDEDRTINTHDDANTWVSLGVFDFVTPANGDFQGVSLSNYAADGTADDDIAWDSVAFQTLPAKPKDFVVQLGDSYSSGEGAEPYLPGTDTGPYADQGSQSSPGRTWNACRRSQNSWIRQTVLPDQTSTIGTLADGNDPSIDYHSAACSGAYTWTMDPALGQAKNWGTLGEFHEVQQLSSGFLDDNTTLVTLTIGGNDAGFSAAVQDCIEVPPLGPGCQSDATVEGQIDSTVKDVKTVLQDIAAEAPHAKIVLLGYPQLFDTGPPCATVVGVGAMITMNGWGSYFLQKDDAMVASLQTGSSPLNVVFKDPSTEFDGYQDCGSKTPGINDDVAAPTGPGDFSCPGNLICPSMESFHPNNTGVKRYALALQDALG
ncbi:golvesin C-terminal-like domain-containing protein [Streptacidiphilus cavernicola]|uniref:Golvesin/Xly CBD-like domain-containing protein n=1 Tax=Streptacidiphilus cavernicola TaxID=3342716 RepID=A0ABV6W5C0_9ACTN